MSPSGQSVDWTVNQKPMVFVKYQIQHLRQTAVLCMNLQVGKNTSNTNVVHNTSQINRLHQTTMVCLKLQVNHLLLTLMVFITYQLKTTSTKQTTSNKQTAHQHDKQHTLPQINMEADRWVLVGTNSP